MTFKSPFQPKPSCDSTMPVTPQGLGRCHPPAPDLTEMLPANTHPKLAGDADLQLITFVLASRERTASSNGVFFWLFEQGYLSGTPYLTPPLNRQARTGSACFSGNSSLPSRCPPRPGCLRLQPQHLLGPAHLQKPGMRMQRWQNSRGWGGKGRWVFPSAPFLFIHLSCWLSAVSAAESLQGPPVKLDAGATPTLSNSSQRDRPSQGLSPGLLPAQMRSQGQLRLLGALCPALQQPGPLHRLPTPGDLAGPGWHLHPAACRRARGDAAGTATKLLPKTPS